MLNRVGLRAYGERDAAATLAIFLDSITQTAAADYTPAQIQAWARPASRDLETWHSAMNHRDSFIAVIDGEVAGFSDVAPDGYIDMLFVAPRFQRQGVGTRVLNEAERRAHQARAHSLWANVSVTARPLFECHGFLVEGVQYPSPTGIALKNYRMSKSLS